MVSNIQNEIEESTYIVQQNAKQERSVLECIQQTKHIQARQAYARDFVAPSKGDALKGKETSGKPKLPAPTSSFKGLTQEDGENQGETMGLIAIIGEVMALQAKSNSNFWKLTWNQASESMMAEVNFAPVIAGAIEDSYKAQAAATQAQADSAETSGIINICAFGGAMVMGGVEGYKSAVKEEGQEAIRVAQETESSADGAAGSGKTEAEDADAGAAASGVTADTAEETVTDTEDGATTAQQGDNQTRQTSDETYKGRKKWKDIIMDKMGKVTKRAGPILKTGFDRYQQAFYATQGFNSLFVDAHYKTIEATQQGLQGQAQALSKEGEMVAQFYGQSFSRLDELARGAQANLDYAMKILESAASTITQTVTSMFRN